MTGPGRKPCGAKTRLCKTCGCHRQAHRETDDGRGACSCGRCTWFVAKPCGVTLVGKGGRCHRHGGASLDGMAHPKLKTDGPMKHRWFVSLSGPLGDRFEAARRDPTLGELHHLLALSDALITDYLGKLKATGRRPLTVKQEDRILALLESHRKLVEAEARRQRDLQLFITASQFSLYVDVCTQLFIEFVPDVQQRLEIQKRLKAALLKSKRPDDDPGGDGDDHDERD